MVSVTGPDARRIHESRARHQDRFKAHVSFEPDTFLVASVDGGS